MSRSGAGCGCWASATAHKTTKPARVIPARIANILFIFSFLSTRHESGLTSLPICQIVLLHKPYCVSYAVNAKQHIRFDSFVIPIHVHRQSETGHCRTRQFDSNYLPTVLKIRGIQVTKRHKLSGDFVRYVVCHGRGRFLWSRNQANLRYKIAWAFLRIQMASQMLKISCRRIRRPDPGRLSGIGLATTIYCDLWRLRRGSSDVPANCYSTGYNYQDCGSSTDPVTPASVSQ